MELKKFLKTWKGAVSENVFHRYLLAGQSVALIVCMFALMQKDRVTVVVPPTLSEKAEIARQAASSGYKQAWGLYIAELLGNLTPYNVDFIVDTLSSMMSPELLSKFRSYAATEVDRIKRNGIKGQYQPRDVRYEKGTDKVFVTGHQVLDATGTTQETSFARVFEVQVAIKAGMPIITYFDTYSGPPRTQDVADRLSKDQAAKDQLEQQKEQDKLQTRRQELRDQQAGDL